MKSIKKTYIARGLLEWQMALKIGDVTVKILFSGGSMGSNGVIPARYTTDNPVIQKAIESSRHYASHRITAL